jgi:PhoPQ-activated pathogenicity-related protein
MPSVFTHRGPVHAFTSRLLSGLAGAAHMLSSAAMAGGLEDYVSRPDPHYNWKRTEQRELDGVTAHRLELVSQHWRNQFWSHYLVVVRPAEVRIPDIALLWITGDSDGGNYVETLKLLAQRAGALAGVITKVPNQPLYDGRKEDALIAFTFDQYMKTGDATWPLLFPMVKSAVRGVDTVQAFAESEFRQKVSRFVLTGQSKRGWTTWLTGAVDGRVAGIAPQVIDMLNMRKQLEWAETVYGKQSEQIHDYTDMNLHLKMDDAAMQTLRGWVDPYEYRDRYTLPKLLLLGTNDPYWTVDSLRHYWAELPEPKLVLQTPNAGHDLAGGRDAVQTLALFFQMIADRQALPTLTWRFENEEGKARVRVSATPSAKALRLWTADSADRDLRDDKWSSRELQPAADSRECVAEVESPKQGYRAYLVEAEFVAGTGHTYRLSTEARVTPDGIR